MSIQSASRGRFITVEGGEGGGKTTNIAFICELLKKSSIDFIVTREPGGTPFAEEVRELLLSPREEPVDAMAELLLVFAARAQHLNTKIIPALDRGLWVISDRFTDATYAYQGAGRNLDVKVINALEALVQGDLRPDATLILDLPVEVGMARASKRGALDRFELEEKDFFNRIRTCYLERAAANPSYYKVVDASQTLVNVQGDIEKIIVELIE